MQRLPWPVQIYNLGRNCPRCGYKPGQDGRPNWTITRAAAGVYVYRCQCGGERRELLSIK